eukprot:5981916-Pleurochrysis_carterae.AAC.4
MLMFPSIATNPGFEPWEGTTDATDDEPQTPDSSWNRTKAAKDVFYFAKLKKFSDDEAASRCALTTRLRVSSRRQIQPTQPPPLALLHPLLHPPLTTAVNDVTGINYLPSARQREVVVSTMRTTVAAMPLSIDAASIVPGELYFVDLNEFEVSCGLGWDVLSLSFPMTVRRGAFCGCNGVFGPTVQTKRDFAGSRSPFSQLLAAQIVYAFRTAMSL